MRLMVIAVFLLDALAAVACCMLSSEISRMEEELMRCYRCSMVEECQKAGKNLCEENGWEDALWQKEN